MFTSKNFKIHAGFTLIELTIAMIVFVIFIAVVFSSGLFLARAFRSANEERLMYQEAQYLLGFMSQNIRAGTIDYSCYGDSNCESQKLDENNGFVDNTLAIRLPEGQRVIFQKNEENALRFVRQIESDDGTWRDASDFSDGFAVLSRDSIVVERLAFLITPVADPYQSENVSKNEVQYQPRVTIFITLRPKTPFRSGNMRLDFQTTLSSRTYKRL
ncbi:prepilin-type N-terminal cleavage/methylation domain-containing protein [Candidatus Peregrinibacteria bacterium]|nr:prepilin-type N-terminal cleavage/methylation domain-containing protein [Candidatus Peregrinibacteria bacterium]